MATPRSTLTRIALVGVLAAAGTGVYLATRADQPTTAVAANIFKTATVEEGSLGTTEKIDGSVVLSDVTTVLHRIEGQVSSSVNSSSSNSNSSSPTGNAPAASGLVSTSATSTAEALSFTSQAAATPTDCTAQPTMTTLPDAPVTTSTTQVPISTPDASIPDGTAPTTTAPSSPTTPTAPTPPTTDCATSNTTATTVPGATGASGSFPSGGGSSTGGATTGSANSASGNTDRVTQVVTSVINDGSPVVLGTVLYSVESSPVVALAGSQPAWRTLDTSSDDGIDVLQLEMSLTALGYDPDGTMTVDTHFDSDTKAVVKAWQAGYGIEVTGTVDLGSVVFVGADITVTGTDVVVGDEVGDGDAILSLSAASQQVVIDVPDGDEAYLVPGLVVKIGSGEGTVTLLRSVERDSAVVVQAVITPTGAIEGANNGSTITVTIALSSLDGVLLVPTEALVSRIDGSYALQVLADDDTSSFVAVELLGVSGSSAAIRGDGIVTGTQVLQPA